MKIDAKVMRIVSLLPAATEIICALGLRARLFGRSHECDHPPGVETLPVCSRPRYNPDGPGHLIDAEVTAILRDALSIYRVDVESLRTIRPTHIVTQSQCRVCAVSTGEIRRSLEEVVGGNDIEIVDLNPESLDGVIGSIGLVAAALGVREDGIKLAADMKSAFEKLRGKSAKSSHSPTVAQIEWIDPLMAAGHWMLELVGIAGGVNVFPGGSARKITFDDLVGTDPEVIMISPCGFSIDRTLGNMSSLTSQPAWNSLRAVKKGRVFVSDGSQYFSRPGPRLVDSAEILSEVFLPDMFPPRHRGSGWVRFVGHRSPLP